MYDIWLWHVTGKKYMTAKCARISHNVQHRVLCKAIWGLGFDSLVQTKIQIKKRSVYLSSCNAICNREVTAENWTTKSLVVLG